MAEPDADALVTGQYADRTHLRPVLDAVLAALPSVGDVTVTPRGTCVSLFSPRRVFAAVQPTTKNRVDLGLRLHGVTSDRLLPAKNVGSGAITTRVALSTADDVDEEVVGWLAMAYRQSTAPTTPRAPRRKRTGDTPLAVLIEGHDLPGLSCHPGPEGEHTAVHVGVPTKDKRPPAVPVPGKPWWATELVPGDAERAVWEFTVTVGTDADGLDFAGPAVRGDRTDRHIGLVWGDFDGTELRMFRGAKLRLVDVDPDVVAAAARPGHRLVGRLGLTDPKGNPVCARVHGIEWSAQAVGR